MSKYLWIVEIAIVALFGVYFGREFLNFDPQYRIGGNEGQWLSSAALWVSQSLQDYGYIPQWQPFLSRGEPTFDSPFSFALHPVNILPSVLFGYDQGIKISVILSLLMAGVGGWWIAKLLDLRSPTRVFLGALMIVKGPTFATLSLGYFQLGVTQCYLPLVFASALALVGQPQRRYPVVLLALTITLIFWGGNIYYTLPALILAAMVIAAHLIIRSRGRWQIDYRLLRRWSWAMLLTIGFAAVTLIPLLSNQALIGRHPNEIGAGRYYAPFVLITQLFTPEHLSYEFGTWSENYYLYTLPLWYAGLILSIGPLLIFFQPTANLRYHRHLLVILAIIALFFLTWGTATNPIIAWAYEQLPLIARWRVVGRMLTLVTLCVAIFAAMRLDHLLLWFWQNADRRFGRIGAVLLILLSFEALLQVDRDRFDFGGLTPENADIRACLEWLRDQDENAHFSVFTRDYYTVTPFIRNRIRLSHINADYDPLGIPITRYYHDLSEIVPEYMIPYDAIERRYWGTRGYVPISASPKLQGKFACLWYHPDALTYAFTLSVRQLIELNRDPPFDHRMPFPRQLTEPITNYQFHPGLIRLLIDNPTSEDRVLIVQEVAWRGWSVTINGQPAPLESIGQLIGVIVPPSPDPLVIMFRFESPLLRVGQAITVLSLVIAMIYLASGHRMKGIT